MGVPSRRPCGTNLATFLARGASRVTEGARNMAAQVNPTLLAESAPGAYASALEALNRAEVPYLVGGTYAFERYTGIARATKDLDLFVRREDRDRALSVLADMGLRTEVAFPHWLAKAHQGDATIDVIYGAGNGVAMVDDEWFEHGVAGEVLGVPTRLVPVVEMIWSKAFLMEKFRYDGADVAHLLLQQGRNLDWGRLLRRFETEWRVLLAHLTLFGFIYPAHRTLVPADLIATLCYRLRRESDSPGPDDAGCQGVLLSRKQYRVDVEQWGFRDARLDGAAGLSERDVDTWTRAAPGEPPAEG
jgi:hypothetical protein